MTTLLFEHSSAKSSRDRILAYLAEHGGRVNSADGCNLTTAMAEGTGYASVTALNAMLARMERDGLIEREVRGKRTYGISLTRAARNAGRNRAMGGQRLGGRRAAATSAGGVELGLAELLAALGNVIAGIRESTDDLSRRVALLEKTKTSGRHRAA
jgi:hypothetical protein